MYMYVCMFCCKLLSNRSCIRWVLLTVQEDYCGDSPCQNGGTCTNLENTYMCECDDGYNGINCETREYCVNVHPLSKISNGVTVFEV